MRKISKPTEQCDEVYATCISVVKNIDLKKRLSAGAPFVFQAFTEFELKVTTGKLHTVKRDSIINGNIKKKELEDVYTVRMMKKKAPGRVIYDQIIASALGGICPFCSQREATTIDHYLPKTEYPCLTVVPANLLPCCKDCNKLKGTLFPTLKYEEFIHPYYDDVENDQWLDAKILQTNPCSFQYFVSPPSSWSQLQADRMQYHFEKLQLGKLYSTQAAVELSMIQFRLNKLLATKSGVRAVSKYLAEAEETRSQANINSWQAVFYKTAQNDNWFKHGGFR